MAKVSVIIPVYNGEKTIKRCLDSVLSQTLKDMEVIVINDGSCDKTGDILREYADRVIVINTNNGGQGRARNLGMAAASGEYLGFVDADDTIEEKMYEVMYNAARQSEAQVVQCAIRDIRENGDVQIRANFNEVVNIEDRGGYVYDYFYKMKHTNEVCNKLIEKRFLLNSGLGFSDTREFFSEDFKLNMEMLLKLKKIRFVDGVFYNYYIKDTGHCRADEVGRVSKILHLFEKVLENDMDSETRKGLECVAALTMLLYCAAAAGQAREFVKNVLSNEAMRKYMKTSMTYKSSLKHSILMAALLYLPSDAKILPLVKFYTFG